MATALRTVCGRRLTVLFVVGTFFSASSTEGSTFDVPVTFDEDFNELGESFQQLDSIMTGSRYVHGTMLMPKWNEKASRLAGHKSSVRGKKECTAPSQFEDKVDYQGSDLIKGGVPGGAADAKACCEACAAHATCKFWTWAKNNKKCWLKSAMSGWEKQSNREAGKVKDKHLAAAAATTAAAAGGGGVSASTSSAAAAATTAPPPSPPAADGVEAPDDPGWWIKAESISEKEAGIKDWNWAEKQGLTG